MVQTIITNALQGETAVEQLITWDEPIRQPAATAPVLAEDGTVLGVVYTRFINLPSTGTILASVPPVVLTFVVPWVIFSTLVGMLYGWIAGRGFSRRLKRLTAASAAMASGDLSQRVPDTSVDEIGQLSQQFNAMADQLASNVRDLRLLADRNAQLAEQATQLATVEERNRLARDLHDSVSQELFSLTMLAAATRRIIATQPELAAAQLEEIQEMSQRALNETRSLILALRPAALGDRGLAPALRDLASSAQNRQGLDVELQISGERRVPLEHEQALFRIVQEALANVARHSGTRAAQVALCYEEGHVALTVSDQGRGFDLQAPRSPRSVGLESMAERAAELGGTLDLQSAPGRGTILKVTLPTLAPTVRKEGGL